MAFLVEAGKKCPNLSPRQLHTFILMCSWWYYVYYVVVTPVDGPQQTAVQPNEYTISFTVSPPVSPGEIQWLFGGAPLPENDPTRQLSNNRLSLTLNPTIINYEGQYQLVTSDGTGSVLLDVQSK